MPKVTEEYKEQMRRRILKAAVSAAEDRPAYELTMRDVIRSAELSPGAVYSYYRDIDELWVDFFNTAVRLGVPGAPKTAREPGETLSAYIHRLLAGEAEFLRTLPLPIGKIIFELDTRRAANPAFAQKRRENVRVLIDYHNALHTLEREIQTELDAGTLHPSVDTETVLMLLQTSLDGILRDIILERCYGLQKSAPIDETKLLNALAESLCALLDL